MNATRKTGNYTYARMRREPILRRKKHAADGSCVNAERVENIRVRRTRTRLSADRTNWL